MLNSGVTATLVIGLVALTVLVVASVRCALKYFRTSNAALNTTVQLMDRRVAHLRAISAACEENELADLAAKVMEDIRFSDSAIVLPLDSEIDDAIAKVDQAIRINDVSAAEEELNRVKRLTEQRRAEKACARKGSF